MSRSKVDLNELDKILHQCTKWNVHRVKWMGVEVEFKGPQPQMIQLPTMPQKPGLNFPADDVEMPKDMLGWSTPLTVEEDNKSKNIDENP